VAPPATCKDCLSVGASLNDRESFLGYTAGEYLLVFIFHYKKILLSTMGAWRFYRLGAAGEAFNLNALAYFSSRGPTADGRLKPEITVFNNTTRFICCSMISSRQMDGGLPLLPASVVRIQLTAPSRRCGELLWPLRPLQVLSHSFTQYITISWEGIAAIVREYFMRGFYTTSQLRPNPTDGFVPSGALIKAILIHSGQRLTSSLVCIIIIVIFI